MHADRGRLTLLTRLPIYRGVARGGGARGALPPNFRLSGFFDRKNWLCWDVGSALFSKDMEPSPVLGELKFEGDN